MYYAQLVVFISSFQLYFIDIHIYRSFNVPYLIENENNFLVVLMINVPQSNVNYVTNLTILQIANLACEAHINYLYVRMINMCMDKRNEFGKHLFIFRI